MCVQVAREAAKKCIRKGPPKASPLNCVCPFAVWLLFFLAITTFCCLLLPFHYCAAPAILIQLALHLAALTCADARACLALKHLLIIVRDLSIQKAFKNRFIHSPGPPRKRLSVCKCADTSQYRLQHLLAQHVRSQTVYGALWSAAWMRIATRYSRDSPPPFPIFFHNICIWPGSLGVFILGRLPANRRYCLTMARYAQWALPIENRILETLTLDANHWRLTVEELTPEMLWFAFGFGFQLAGRLTAKLTASTRILFLFERREPSSGVREIVQKHLFENFQKPNSCITVPVGQAFKFQNWHNGLTSKLVWISDSGQVQEFAC